MEFDPVDRISELPDVILHKILSYVVRRDAARTCVLSKRWNSVWECFPFLVFYEFFHIRRLAFLPYSDPKSKEARSNFLSTVVKCLTRFCVSELPVERFGLIMNLVHPNSASIAGHCLELALKCKASRIALLVESTNQPETLLETSAFSDPIGKYYFLQTLSLSGIRASEKTIEDIARNCPNITSLALGRLGGLKSLGISNLGRLESVTINSTELLRVDIDAPKLRNFCIRSSCKDMPNCPIINLTLCPGLRTLSLGNLAITDGMFRSLVSGIPLLEELEVSYCEKLRSVVISAPRLRSLDFRGCNRAEAIEIDAPCLSSFSYIAETLSRLVLSNIPSRFEINYSLYGIPITNSNFMNLRQFLATSAVGDILTVTVNTRQVIFDREELRQVVIPPAFQLQHLKLEFTANDRTFDKQTLVDGLLWSCHPKAITVSSGTEFKNSFIKILCESLLETEKYAMCCDSSHIKCWRHDLKSAMIESFGVNWSVLLEKLPCDGSNGPVILFKLEWNDSI